jgi:hypothetical protein
MTAARRSAARRRLGENRERELIAMTIFSRSIAGLILVAVAAGAYGYERLRHRHPSLSAETPKPATLSLAPPMPPTPPGSPAAARVPTLTPPIEPAARMTPAQQAGFDAWLVKTYLGCWKPARPQADADLYVAQVRLAYNPDGSLMKPAKLVNPPSDPALKPQAKSVMAAVENCNPLPVPAQYRPFYEQWKTKTIHFDPQVATR